MSNSKVPNFKTPNPIAELAALKKQQIAGNTAYSKRIEASKDDYDSGRGSVFFPYTNPDENLGDRARETRGEWKEERKIKPGESNWFTDKARLDDVTPPKPKYTINASGFNCYVEGQGVYEEGETCILYALVIDPTYEFIHWVDEEGVQVTTSNIYAFEVTGNATYYAIAEKIVPPIESSSALTATCDHGSVEFDPVGQTVIEGEGYYYGETTQVALTAHASSGYKFSKWVNRDTLEVSYANPLTVNVTVTEGEFHHYKYIALTTPTVPEKYTIIADGVHCKVRGAGLYLPGETAILSVEPDEGYKFVMWSDGETDNPRYIYVQADAEYYAICRKSDPTPPESDLILVEYSAINGSVNVQGPDPKYSGEGYGYYHYGDEITLTCYPRYGFEFVSWYDGIATAQRTVVVRDRCSFVGICKVIETVEETCTIITQTSNCAIEPAEGTFAWGMQKSFTAHVDPGYTFFGWFLDGVLYEEQSTTLSIIIPSQKYLTITAVAYAALPDPTSTQCRLYVIGVNGLTTGSGIYEASTTAHSYKFYPNTGYEFVEWIDQQYQHISYDNPAEITITGAMLGTTIYRIAIGESLDPIIKKYTITTTSAHGDVVLTPSIARYTYGTEVQVAFENIETGYEFNRFIVNGTPIFSNPITLSVYSNIYIDGVATKIVDPKPGSYDVALEAIPAVGGKIDYSIEEATISSTESDVLQLPEGTSVYLHADAKSNYEFAHWSDYGTTAEGRTIVVPPYPTFYGAYFESTIGPTDVEHFLIYSTNGDIYINKGSETEPAESEYTKVEGDRYEEYVTKGTHIWVKIVPKAHHKFRWWYSKGAKISSNPRHFVVTKATIDYAFCGPEQYRVYVPASPYYTVTQQGKTLSQEGAYGYGVYTYGELCKLTCTPNEVEDQGFYFEKWQSYNKAETLVGESEDNPWYFFVNETVTVKPVVHGTSLRVITEKSEITGEYGYSDVYFDKSHALSTSLVSVEYSVDEGTTWNDLPTSVEEAIQWKGTLLIRSKNASDYDDGDNESNWGKSPYAWTNLEKSAYSYTRTGYCRLSFGNNAGNKSPLTLQGYLSTLGTTHHDSVVYGRGLTVNGAYGNIFSDNPTIVDASKLVIPSRRIGYEHLGYNYLQSLFEGCTGLVKAPALPALYASGFAYAKMFANCVSLKTPPYIAVTGSSTLKVYRGLYFEMFLNCIALQEPCIIGTDKLGPYACTRMFQGCTSLTKMPAIPYDSEGNACSHAYEAMFYGCKSLKYVTPLDSTTAEEYCYAWMFGQCTALETAPIIAITKIKDGNSGSFMNMFEGCTHLKYLYISMGKSESCSNWLKGAGTAVSPLETKIFISDYADSWNTASRDDSHVPASWNLRPYYVTIESTSGGGFTLRYQGNPTGHKVNVGTSKLRWFYLNTESENLFKDPSSWPHTISLTSSSWITLQMTGPIMIANERCKTKVTFYKEEPFNNIIKFRFGHDDRIRIGGRASTLLEAASFSGSAPIPIMPSSMDSMFEELFMAETDAQGNTYPTIVDAEHFRIDDQNSMFVEGTSLGFPGNYLWRRAFMNQSLMTKFPTYKPNMIPAKSFFESTFEGCSGVTEFSSPYLGRPDTELPASCYKNCFKGCTSLNAAATLNLPVIGESACEGMFEGCTSLTAAPIGCLQTSVAKNACKAMFKGCIKFIENGYTFNCLAEGAYESIYEGCTMLGSTGLTFATLTESEANKNIPANCFKNAYKGCTSLSWPLSLAFVEQVGASGFESCYEGCTALPGCSAIGSDTLATLKVGPSAMKAMYRGCTALKAGYSFAPLSVIDGAANYASALESCFEGCTAFVYAPRIPHAQSNGTQADSVFKYMYKGCTSLESTPIMYCRSLNENAFIGMFQGCSSLYAVHTYGLIVDDASIANWLEGVPTSPGGIVYCPKGSELKKTKYLPHTNWAFSETEAPTVDTLKFEITTEGGQVTYVASYDGTTHLRKTAVKNDITLYQFHKSDEIGNTLFTPTLVVTNDTSLWYTDQSGEWQQLTPSSRGAVHNGQFADDEGYAYVLAYNTTTPAKSEWNGRYPVMKVSSETVYWITTIMPAVGGGIYESPTATETATTISAVTAVD